MNGLLILVALGLLFYVMHRMHEQVGSCHERGGPGRDAPEAPAAEGQAGHQPGAGKPQAPVGRGVAVLLVVVLLVLLPMMLLHRVTRPGSLLHALWFWLALALPLVVGPWLLRRLGPSLDGGRLEAELEAAQEQQEAKWRSHRWPSPGGSASRSRP